MRRAASSTEGLRRRSQQVRVCYRPKERSRMTHPPEQASSDLDWYVTECERRITELEERFRVLEAQSAQTADMRADAYAWPCGCVKGKTPHGAGWLNCLWRNKPCEFPRCVEGDQPPFCGNCADREMPFADEWP